MLGAREGCYKTNCTDWDYANVRDFEWLTDYWKEQGYGPATDINYRLKWLGNELRTELDLEISDVDSAGSKFFKKVYMNTERILRR
jgi:hypothetical protein